MKFKVLVGALVLGLGLCTQTFAFDLLDRMLGINGCGCNSGCAAKSCCTKPADCAQKPSCAAAAPTCGADNGCNKGCKSNCCRKIRCSNKCNSGCAAPTCGAAAPSCGCEKACKQGCKDRCRPCLLDRLFSCNSSCKPKCASGCSKGCAAAPTCGSNSAAPAEAKQGNDSIAPPAPVVDPSAFLPTQRRVVHASASLVR